MCVCKCMYVYTPMYVYTRLCVYRRLCAFTYKYASTCVCEYPLASCKACAVRTVDARAAIRIPIQIVNVHTYAYTQGSHSPQTFPCYCEAHCARKGLKRRRGRTIVQFCQAALWSSRARPSKMEKFKPPPARLGTGPGTGWHGMRIGSGGQWPICGPRIFFSPHISHRCAPSDLKIAHSPCISHRRAWLTYGLYMVYTWPAHGLHMVYTWPTYGQ